MNPIFIGKNIFIAIHFYSKIFADFEADNEKDDSSVSNKTTNIYKQNPVLNGYEIISDLQDVFKSGHYKSPLGNNNVEWFDNQVMKLENKLAFYFKNTKKGLIKTKEKEEDFDNNIICRFCDKGKISDKVRDHCHVTGNHGGPAHSKCSIIVIQDKSNIPFVFHNFSNFDCHMFF